MNGFKKEGIKGLYLYTQYTWFHLVKDLEQEILLKQKQLCLLVPMGIKIRWTYFATNKLSESNQEEDKSSQQGWYGRNLFHKHAKKFTTCHTDHIHTVHIQDAAEEDA